MTTPATLIFCSSAGTAVLGFVSATPMGSIAGTVAAILLVAFVPGLGTSCRLATTGSVAVVSKASWLLAAGQGELRGGILVGRANFARTLRPRADVGEDQMARVRREVAVDEDGAPCLSISTCSHLCSRKCNDDRAAL